MAAEITSLNRWVDRRRVDWASGHHRRLYETFGMGRGKMTKLDFVMRFWWLPYILTALMGTVYVVSRPGVPIVAHSVQVLTPTVRAGEVARFVYTMHRNRTCPATINGFWIDDTGRAVARLDSVPGGYGKVGDVQTPVDIRTPAVLGRLAYRSYMFSICETGSFVMVSPDAWVKVVP